jgi:anhydro-N-acetylmuramic acid kinase
VAEGFPASPALAAIGTISGTSADAIDLALVRSDGVTIAGLGPHASRPYRPTTRAAILDLLTSRREVTAGDVPELVAAITDDHAAAVERFTAEHGLSRADVDLVAFHGQTVLHRPERRLTVQLGDPQALACRLGIPVVGDLRQADVAAGGQGAPIVPLYHQALARGWPQPVVLLNIGGVSNLTFLDGESVIAFDVGPGNAPIDDWVRRHTGAPCDEGGRIAARGRADPARIERALAHPYFAAPWPKSLDRMAYPPDLAAGLGLEDGAATLAGLAVAAVARAAALLPARPRRWLVCGGGRHNPTLMQGLAAALAAPVLPIEAEGLDGDAIEAQAMAYLGIRSRLGLPLTLPTTTGVPAPMPGGRTWWPRASPP